MVVLTSWTVKSIDHVIAASVLSVECLDVYVSVVDSVVSVWSELIIASKASKISVVVGSAELCCGVVGGHCSVCWFEVTSAVDATTVTEGLTGSIER